MTPGNVNGLWKTQLVNALVSLSFRWRLNSPGFNFRALGTSIVYQNGAESIYKFMNLQSFQFCSSRTCPERGALFNARSIKLKATFPWHKISLNRTGSVSGIADLAVVLILFVLHLHKQYHELHIASWVKIDALCSHGSNEAIISILFHSNKDKTTETT